MYAVSDFCYLRIWACILENQFRQKCIGTLVNGLVRDVGKGLVCDVGVGSTHGTPVVINL